MTVWADSAPVATADTADADEDVAAEVHALAATDADADADALGITGFTQGAHGSVVLDDNGTAEDAIDDFLLIRR